MRFLLTTMIWFAIISQTNAQEDLIGSALDNYGKVAGAWFLAQNCKFLDEESAKEFEQNVATINIALAIDLGNPRILFMIQNSAKQVSESNKYAKCDNNAKEIVDWGVMYSEAWSAEIKKLQSSK